MPDHRDDLSDQIEQNASGPREARGDSGGMTQHSLRDQIEADKYLAAKRALRCNPLGIRTVRLSPGNNIDHDFRGGM
jgi:hypothetical protein